MIHKHHGTGSIRRATSPLARIDLNASTPTFQPFLIKSPPS